MDRAHLTAVLLGLASSLACFDDPLANMALDPSSEEDTGSEGDGDGDTEGNGDGDGDGLGDGDGDVGGDGDGDPTGDGDGEPEGDGDGDEPGDGDGDEPGDGDGDDDPSAELVVLDFAADLCDFGVETLISFDPGGEELTFPACPTPDKFSPIGGALVEDDPILDDGVAYPGPQLLIYPPLNAAPQASLSVQFDYVSIEAGDRLQFVAGCGAGKQTCSANVQVNYFTVQNQLNSLISEFAELSDGQTFEVDMPLDAFAGQSISLLLYVGSAADVGDDGVYFADGRIVRPG